MMMMMISAPTMCTSSSRIPQPERRRLCTHSPVLSQQLVPSSSSPLRRRAGLKWSGGFPKTRGDSTFAARKQASGQASPSSSFSSAEAEADASDDEEGEEVPAKEEEEEAAGVRNCTGTKNVELSDSILSTKLVPSIDDQLPPLLSMIIDGFPPLQQSKYVQEAEKRLHQYAELYPNVASLYSFYRVGLSTASYGHPKVINIDRLVVISMNYALWIILDDLFYDTSDEFLLDQYGISRSVCGSPQNILEYLDYLDAVFSQQVQPQNLTPIETLMWEVGRDTLELSNPEWFNNYVAGVVEHHHASAASLVDIVEGHNICFQDVESYTNMRAGNIGGTLIQLMIEFAKDTYIPSKLRANPYLEDVTTATSIHLGFVNDLFSYHKESLLEQNPRNLITVLMECEGKPFIQTSHMAIDLVNTYAREIIDLEARAWNSTLQNHLHDIKALIAGSIYYSSMELRYRHPNSVFPELRDITSSWKILPLVKGPRL